MSPRQTTRVTTPERESMSEAQPRTQPIHGAPQPRRRRARRAAGPGRAIALRRLNAYYGDTHAVKDVDLDYAANRSPP